MTETSAQLIAQIITYLGATPIVLAIVLLGLAPWGTVIFVMLKLNKIVGKISMEQSNRLSQVFERQDKRFEQVVRMYEDNVGLVKSHQSLVENQGETNNKLIDLVSISTATQQTLVDYIKSNMFCPLVKQTMRPDRIKGVAE